MKYALLLVCCGCVSASQWQTFKSHALETGIATAGGAAAIATGGAAGLAIAGGGMAAGALAGELNKPPPAEIHTTTTVDEKGRILDQKTTRFEAAHMTESHWYDFLPTGGWWKFVYLAIAIWIVTHPKLVRGLIGAFTIAEKGMSNLYTTAAKKFKRVPKAQKKKDSSHG